MVVYEPREDSELLARYVRRYAFGRTLDIGTGSGIQAVAAASRRTVRSIVGVDIDKGSISYCRRKIKNKKIRFLRSNLFSAVHRKMFDTIIFNPPYLPSLVGEPVETARAVAGGKYGYEILERFFCDARAFLTLKGVILIVFSSLTQKQRVDEIITRNGFIFTQLEDVPLFFEKLYCYRIQWDPRIIAVTRKGVTHLSYFTHGKRGVLFTGRYSGKKIVVKIKRKESAAVGRMENEARWLKRLNVRRIGPRFSFSGRDFLVYEFVYGDSLICFIEKNKKEDIRGILVTLIEQCFVLDEMGVNKEEMHHPHKHIVIRGRRATLLDFERTHRVARPHNVTQFVQFICSLRSVLSLKGFSYDVSRLRELAVQYKREPTRERLREVLVALK